MPHTQSTSRTGLTSLQNTRSVCSHYHNFFFYWFFFSYEKLPLKTAKRQSASVLLLQSYPSTRVTWVWVSMAHSASGSSCVLAVIVIVVQLSGQVFRHGPWSGSFRTVWLTLPPTGLYCVHADLLKTRYSMATFSLL